MKYKLIIALMMLALTAIAQVPDGYKVVCIPTNVSLSELINQSYLTNDLVAGNVPIVVNGVTQMISMAVFNIHTVTNTSPNNLQLGSSILVIGNTLFYPTNTSSFAKTSTPIVINSATQYLGSAVFEIPGMTNLTLINDTPANSTFVDGILNLGTNTSTAVSGMTNLVLTVQPPSGSYYSNAVLTLYLGTNASSSSGTGITNNQANVSLNGTFTVNGSNDVVQMNVKANVTQNSPVLQVLDSSSTVKASIDKNGNAVLAGGLSVAGTSTNLNMIVTGTTTLSNLNVTGTFTPTNLTAVGTTTLSNLNVTGSVYQNGVTNLNTTYWPVYTVTSTSTNFLLNPLNGCEQQIRTNSPVFITSVALSSNSAGLMGLYVSAGTNTIRWDTNMFNWAYPPVIATNGSDVVLRKCFGSTMWTVTGPGLSVTNLGGVSTASVTSIIYSNAGIFVATSGVSRFVTTNQANVAFSNLTDFGTTKLNSLVSTNTVLIGSTTCSNTITASNLVLSTARWVDSPMTLNTNGVEETLPAPYDGIVVSAYSDNYNIPFTAQINHNITASNATGYVEPHLHVLPTTIPPLDANRKKFQIVYAGAQLGGALSGPWTNIVDNVALNTNTHTLVEFSHLSFTNFYPGISGKFWGRIIVMEATASNFTGRVSLDGDFHYPTDRLGSAQDATP